MQACLSVLEVSSLTWVWWAEPGSSGSSGGEVPCLFHFLEASLPYLACGPLPSPEPATASQILFASQRSPPTCLFWFKVPGGDL